MGFGEKMRYQVKTGKDLVKNSKNIDGILLEKSVLRGKQLFFNKEEENFSYYTDVSVYNGLEYRILLEKVLRDDNPSFNLFRSSYWHNLFHSGENDTSFKETGSYARLFGVANDGHNRCCVGCFSCGEVIVDDDYVVNNNYKTLTGEAKKEYQAKLSLDDVSCQIGINSEAK